MCLKTLYYRILRKKHRTLHYYFDTRFYIKFLHIVVVWEGYPFAHFYSTELQECILKPQEDKCFQDLTAIKFYFKMNYDIQRQATDNSLGSHEYRQLRQCWIIPSNLNYLYLIPLKFSNLNPYFLTSHLCFDSFWFF